MRLLLKHVEFWGLRLIAGLVMILLAIAVYFFSIPQIQIIGLNFVNPVYKYTSNFDFSTYILLYFIVVFFLNFLILSCLTVYYQKKKGKKDRSKKKYEDLFIQKLINHLVLNTDENETASFCKLNLRKYLLHEKTASILLDTLLKVHSKINGNLRIKTNLIAHHLGLEKFIRIYLYSPKLKDRILALKIISAFQLKGYNSRIMSLTASKDSHLRTEAFISLIRLSVLDDLVFLKSFRKLVSLWDINLILTVTRELENINIDYPGLIQSEYSRVSMLGILMAGENKKLEYKDLIKTKIGSSDELLNKEAYTAYLSMVDKTSDFQFLIERFQFENDTIKKLVIPSFQKCPNKELATGFLMNVIEKECLLLKTLAMKILLETDTNKVQYYKNSSSNEVRKAHREAVDLHII